jgi:hypothetical protein
MVPPRGRAGRAAAVLRDRRCLLRWLPVLGLWRSPVAHLVRIEGVRGSNPLSSTQNRRSEL